MRPDSRYVFLTLIASLCLLPGLSQADDGGQAAVPAFLQVHGTHTAAAHSTHSAPQRTHHPAHESVPQQVAPQYNTPSQSDANASAGNTDQTSYSGPSLMDLSNEQAEINRLKMDLARAKLKQEIAQANGQAFASGGRAGGFAAPPQIISTDVSGNQAAAVLQLYDGSQIHVRVGDRVSGGFIVTSIRGTGVTVRHGHESMDLSYFHVSAFAGSAFTSVPPPPVPSSSQAVVPGGQQ